MDNTTHKRKIGNNHLPNKKPKKAPKLPSKKDLVKKYTKQIKKKLKDTEHTVYENGVSENEVSNSEEEGIGSVRDGQDESEETLQLHDETADEKRLRLAKQYLIKLQKQKQIHHSESTSDDFITSRLQHDVLDSGKQYTKQIAYKFEGREIGESEVEIIKGHNLPTTCVVVTSDEKVAFSGAKDATIVKWDLITGRKLGIIKRNSSKVSKSGKDKNKGNPGNINGHCSAVLTLAISYDDEYLISGGEDRTIRIWNAHDLQFIHAFKGHRGRVTGLAFQKNSYQFFSCSDDRSVKIWNAKDLTFLDTLFGHQSEIMSIDSFTVERCITCSMDRTIRVWKISEETQLIYKGHTASIDSVATLSDSAFIAASQDGSISLWHTSKKKPIFELQDCHTGGPIEWVNCVAALPHTDLAASGGTNGDVIIWKCTVNNNPTESVLQKMTTINIPGCVNGMAFGHLESVLVVAIGQEPRLGRWATLPKVKNGIAIIRLGSIKQPNSTHPLPINSSNLIHPSLIPITPNSHKINGKAILSTAKGSKSNTTKPLE